MGLFIIFSCIIGLSTANSVISNESIIEIGAYNIQKDNNGNYLINIYASNDKPIAGLQFEILGEDFEILSVDGGRAKRSGFTFYNSKKGIILAFSLEGKTISPVDDVYKKMNPLLIITAKKRDTIPAELKFKTIDCR